MIAFGHTAVGSVVALATYSYFGYSDPLLGLSVTTGAGIVSHYLADFVPHGHLIKFKDLKKKVFLAAIFDFGLSVGLFSSLAFLVNGLNLKLIYIIVGILSSNLPDIIDGLVYTGKLPNQGLLKIENNLHQLVHWHGKKDKTLKWSLRDLWQVSFILISLLLITKF